MAKRASAYRVSKYQVIAHRFIDKWEGTSLPSPSEALRAIDVDDHFGMPLASRHVVNDQAELIAISCDEVDAALVHVIHVEDFRTVEIDGGAVIDIVNFYDYFHGWGAELRELAPLW